MRAVLLFLSLGFTTASAQWTIQDSHTKASLRGIHSLGNGVAWASGSGGTVLRTIDGGKNWQPCTIPPGAERLDFRGVQAFDKDTAIVMSSGTGDLSRLYKTTDGCQTWKLVFSNPDTNGFWDSITAHVIGPFDQPTCSSSTKAISGSIFGDPAIHKSNAFDNVTIPSFYLATFTIDSSCTPDTLNASASAIFSGPGEAAFAASNSVLYQPGPNLFWLATGRELIQYETGYSSPNHYEVFSVCGMDFPLHHGMESQGVFSFAVRADSIEKPKAVKISKGSHCLSADIVAVGGDYLTPADGSSSAVFTGGGKKFQLAEAQPHGYRSAVAYDPATKTWITVGPNGTDISADDGRNWRALIPGATDQPDADKKWNALSLPFVVGEHGRIGLLRPAAVAAK
jgi:hypothetical protein